MPYFGNNPSPLLLNTVAQNGKEMTLDADADTSITADTDDQIDIKIGGADDFQFTANTFTAQSGSTIAAQALTATTITASGVLDITDTTDSSDATGDTGALRTEGGASIAKKLYVGTDLDVDGTANLDVVDIDGAVDMASSLTVAGAFTSVGIDDNADATTMTIDTSENVGIGNTSPSSQYMTRLVVGDGSGTEGITIHSGNDSLGRLEFSDATSGDGRYAGGVVYNHSTNKLRFNTNGGNERLSIDSDGYVTMSQQPSIAMDGNQSAYTEFTSDKVINEWTSFHTVGISYNSSNGRFTVPADGKYLITVNVYLYQNDAFQRLQIADNDSVFVHSTADYDSGDGDMGQDNSLTCTTIRNLSANDYITFVMLGGGTDRVFFGAAHSHCAIHKLS